MLLTTKGPMTSSVPPKSKMKRPETKLYVKWVIQEITKHPEPFKEYMKGKGIIATRESRSEVFEIFEDEGGEGVTRDGEHGGCT